MAKRTNPTPQAGVSTTTSNDTVATGLDETAGGAPASMTTGGAIEGENFLDANESLENAPVSVQQTAPATFPTVADSDELEKVPVADRASHIHAAEAAKRRENQNVEGGAETVATGLHKGREIKNGAIDFNTPSDRERRQAENAARKQERDAEKAEEETEETGGEKRGGGREKRAA